MGKLYTIKFLLITIFPAWIIYRIINYIIINNKKKFNWKNEILINLFMLYIIFLIGITIFPIYISRGIHPLSNLSIYERLNINLLPFSHYINGDISKIALFRNIFGNFVLLMPLIVFMYIYIKNMRSLKNCALISFLISILIEFTQCILNIMLLSEGLRTVNIDDIILNTLGGVIVFIILNILERNSIIKIKFNNTKYKSKINSK